jgi:hypothetical protein
MFSIAKFQTNKTHSPRMVRACELEVVVKSDRCDIK